MFIKADKVSALISEDTLHTFFKDTIFKLIDENIRSIRTTSERITDIAVTTIGPLIMLFRFSFKPCKGLGQLLFS